jgi:hypothetical protein
MRQLAATQLVNVNRWGFLKEQLFYFMGSCFVILAGLYALLFYDPFKKYRFFFWSLCITLAVFCYLKAKSYYAIGLYPVYIAFGSVYLERITKSDWKKTLQAIMILIPAVLFIPFYNIGFPNKAPECIIQNVAVYRKYGLLRWEDGKDHALPQDYADMLGWKELAIKVEGAYSKLPEAGQTLILCDNYGQAGAINYYAKNKKMTAAVSFSADYVNWFDLQKKYTNLIRVKAADSAGDELKETSPYFTKSYKAGAITNKFAREFGTTIFVFQNAKVNISQRIKEEIAEEKSSFNSQ